MRPQRGDADGSILRFAGYEPESSVPLAAASPLLRRIAAASEDRTFMGLLDPGAEVGGLDAIRIFESVHRQLARLRPSALFVDDLSGSTPCPWPCAHYVVRATDGSGRGLAVVVASRPSPVADLFAAALATVLDEQLRRCGWSCHRSIGRRVSASSLTGRARSIGAMRKISGSAPAALHSGSIFLPRPTTGRGSIDQGRRRSRCCAHPDANHVLTKLAIVGRPIEPLELATLVGLSDERTIVATSELVGRGLAIDAGDVVRPAHDLIRDAVVARTKPATRRRLRTQIASVLERDASGDVTGLLAVLEHRAAAGAMDTDLALRILTSPQRRLIGSDGVRRIAESARGLDDSGVRESVDRAAAALAAELRRPGARSGSLVGGRSRHAGSWNGGRAEFGAAPAAYHLGRGDEARRWLEVSRSRTRRAPDLDIASDGLEARILLWLEHRTDEGRSIAMRGVEKGRLAVATADATGEVRAAHLDALVAAWEAAIQVSTSTRSWRWRTRSVESSRAMGLREEIEARAMFGMALEYAADQREAAGIYRQVLDDAWRAVLPVEAVDVGYRLAAVLLDVLDVREAGRIGAETERLAARVGDQGRPRPDPRDLPGGGDDLGLAASPGRHPRCRRGRGRSAYRLRQTPRRRRLARPTRGSR